MKKKVLVMLIVLSAVISLITSCSGRRYVTPAFYEKSRGHRIIAIVPYEMIFTGKKPKKLTLRQVRRLEELESLAFQDSLYSYLFRQATKRRYPIRIEIQPVEKTNNILEKQGIDIRDSWELNTEELARVLKVDAVVRTKVIKHRYMSGLASFGIEMGNAIVNSLLEDPPRTFVPGKLFL